MEIEDLEMITKSDRKDKKKLYGGPVVYGQKSPWGKPRIGYSIPQSVREDTDREYGISSYHKGAQSDLKQLLSNEFMKEQLMENVSKRVAEIVKQESKPKRGINNKTSTLRAQAIRAKIAEGSE